MHLSQKNCPLSGLVFQNKAFDEEISLICAQFRPPFMTMWTPNKLSNFHMKCFFGYLEEYASK